MATKTIKTDHSLRTRAWELIEKGWCQGNFAKTAKGRPIGLHCASAVCYCLEGALIRVYDPNDKFIPSYSPPHGAKAETKLMFWRYKTLRQLVKQYIRRYYRSYVNIIMPEFNDAAHRTKEQIIKVLKAAEKELDRLEKEAPLVSI